MNFEHLNTRNENERVHDEEKHRAFERQSRQYVEQLLLSGEQRIGKGMSAEVHYYGDESGVCLKVITPETLDARRTMRSITREARMQEEVHDLLDEEGIIVPRPYFEVTFEYTKPDQEDEVWQTCQVMCMERLNAVSLEDVLDRGVAIPETYDQEQFFEMLKDSIETLHDHNIHHRDLRSGNVMIDRESGRPCLIDFEFTEQVYGDEDPYKEQGPRGTSVRPKDLVGLRDMRNEMRQKIDE